MADLKIVIGADFSEVEKQLASLVDSTGDFAKAIDELGKDGALSISFLNKQIKDFKGSFDDATDPEQAKKFGAALQILTVKQQALIDSGLKVADVEERVTKSHGAHTVSTQRLSSSILGLSRVFDVLPPELVHLTHGFDQIFQSFERTANGTETSGEAIKKFAGVLGQVGLGLAIGVVVGLLADFVKGLFDSDAALEKATEEGARFAKQIEDINTSLKDFESKSKFLQQLDKIQLDISLGKGFEGDLIAAQRANVDLIGESFKLKDALDQTRVSIDEAFKSFQEGASTAATELADKFGGAQFIPSDLFKGLNDADKKLIENVKKTNDEFLKLGDERTANERAQALQSAAIAQLRVDNARAEAKKDADAFRRLFESREQIIKEFTAKFASIKDPFPDFFTKNLPLGKVEDKALRAALENAFKVMEKAAKDLFDTQKIDPGTIPLEIKFKPEIVGKTDLVRAIEDNLGDLKKDVQNAVNKGIFELHFNVQPDAVNLNTAALSAFDKLKQTLMSLTGQTDVPVDVNFDVNKFDFSDAEDQIKEAKHLLAVSAAADTITFELNAEGKVKIKINKDKILEDLAKDINQALVTGANTAFAGIGEALGDALSNNLKFDALKTVINGLAGILADVGKALIKAGILMLGLQNAIKKISTNPALAIGLGIALIALSKILQNSIKSSGSREVGGPVAKGLMYLVNERGMEIFQPNNSKKPFWIPGGKQYFQPGYSGNIIPAHQAEQFAITHGIKRLAGGGVTTGPTFALIGERGPEFISPVKSLRSAGLTGNPQLIKVEIVGKTSGRDLKYVNALEDRHQNRTT